MSRKKSLKPLMLLLATLLAAGGAWALKTDKSQPINVRADHGDFKSDPANNSNGTGIYTGHVVITQGSIMLTADKAVLHVVNNELDTADVTGSPATFQQQPDNGGMMRGSAQEITYAASDNEIVLITNARLTQAVDRGPTAVPAPGASTTVSPPDERLMTADRIRYDTDTQHVIARGGNNEERVHLSFPPKTPAAPSATEAAPHGAPSTATGRAPAPTTPIGTPP